MVNINIQIPEDVHKKLKFEALDKDVSLKSLVIEKLDRFSRKNDRK